MMNFKRRVEDGIYEPWLQWHIRRLHNAGEVIKNAGLDLSRKFPDLRKSWVSHLARLGTKMVTSTQSSMCFSGGLSGNGGSSSCVMTSGMITFFTPLAGTASPMGKRFPYSWAPQQ